MEVSMVSASQMRSFLGGGPPFFLALLQAGQRREGTFIFFPN